MLVRFLLRRKQWLLLWFLGLASVVGLYFLPIVHIECRHISQAACTTEEVDTLSTLQGSSLIRLSRKTFTQTPQLASLSVHSLSKELPNKITVVMSPVRPGYNLQSDTMVLYVTAEGTVEQSGTMPSPLVLTVSPLLLSQIQENPELLIPSHSAFMALAEKTQQLLSSPCTSWQWDGHTSLTCQTNTTHQAIFSISRAAIELENLSYLLTVTSLNSIDTTIKEIDLRYTHPVLRTQASNTTST